MKYWYRHLLIVALSAALWAIIIWGVIELVELFA